MNGTAPVYYFNVIGRQFKMTRGKAAFAAHRHFCECF